MSKSLAASQKVMQSYLSELLTEDANDEASALEVAQRDEKLEKLLANIPKPAPEVVDVEPEQILSRKSQPIDVSPIIEQDTEINTKPLVTRKSIGTRARADKAYRKGSFQAMFFDVAGLTIAVPLIELGGIYNSDKATPLMGKPPWFTGVMVHREEKINVVNTAMWVMPEKYDQKLNSSLNYKYIIMLSDSQWGLSAEHLVDTITLEQDAVKWLDAPSKRPWLAGLVKDRKCALLDVESLIQLLNDGADVNSE